MKHISITTPAYYQVPWKPLLNEELLEQYQLKNGTHVMVDYLGSDISYLGVVQTDGHYWWVRLLQNHQSRSP
jgi:hypothetical protein